jgi:hypothetical protein
MEQRKLPNLAILVNDIKLARNSYGYGYGYGYEYGYGYGYGQGYGFGYYSDDRKAEKKSILKRIFGRT